MTRPSEMPTALPQSSATPSWFWLGTLDAARPATLRLSPKRLNAATAGNFQITTDGFAAYRDAVSLSLGTRVDFAQLIKVYALHPKTKPLLSRRSSFNGGGTSHRKPRPG